MMSAFSLSDLEKIVAERARSGDAEFVDGQAVCQPAWSKAAKKLGEEAVETVIAAVKGDDRQRSFRRAPISSIIGWSCWRSPAFRLPT